MKLYQLDRFFWLVTVVVMLLLGLRVSSSENNPFVSYNSYWTDNGVGHYSSVGFKLPLSVEEQMYNTAAFVKDPKTKTIPGCTGGYQIFHLATQSGAELWGGANPNNKFFGNDPHYAGKSRLRMNLREKYEPLDDECIFWGDVMECGTPQFDFLCPTYQLFGKNLSVPTTNGVIVQVAAFAYEIQTFDSLQEYEKLNNEKGS